MLYRDKKPKWPPKQGTEEFDTLVKFCNKVELIIQAVNEDEYQAAVTVMSPPSQFFTTVKFPRRNTVIGMFGKKKTCLLYSNQSLDYSDSVQDTIEDFPNAKFVGMLTCEGEKRGEVED